MDRGPRFGRGRGTRSTPVFKVTSSPFRGAGRSSHGAVRTSGAGRAHSLLVDGSLLVTNCGDIEEGTGPVVATRKRVVLTDSLTLTKVASSEASKHTPTIGMTGVDTEPLTKAKCGIQCVWSFGNAVPRGCCQSSVPGGRATTAWTIGADLVGPGPVVQDIGVTIWRQLQRLEIGLQRVQHRQHLARACSVSSSALGRYGVGMASPWQSLGAPGLGWHGWGPGPVTGSQRNSRGEAKAGFTLLETELPRLVPQRGPSHSSPRCPLWTKLWTGGPTHSFGSSRQRPTSVTAWQPAPTTDGSRTNQSVCFAVRVARVWQTGGKFKNLDPHIGDYSAASDSHRQSDGWDQ